METGGLGEQKCLTRKSKRIISVVKQNEAKKKLGKRMGAEVE